MELIVGKTYEEMSQLAARAVLDLLKMKKEPLVCFPSGSTPVMLCRYLCEHFQQAGTIPDWHFVGLDEWVGMDGNDNGSCRQFFNGHLFGPLGIPGNQIHFFDGKAADLKQECEITDLFIENHGRLELAVLGIGMNGHLGFNEPGSDANLRSHVVDLDETTKTVGQKYFTETKKLEQGITLGLATLLESRTVMLMVNGTHKAEILRKTLRESISSQVPASLLRLHPRFFVYTDEAAASAL